MKYVIWGAGNRGKILYYLLGQEKIEAFIDTDYKKVGQFVNGKPIIDLITYKKKYMDKIIIATPVYANEIEKTLKKEHIFFFKIEDCPTEYMGYGLIKFLKERKELELNYKEKYAIYGCTLHGVLLYDYLMKKGHTEVDMIIHEGFGLLEQQSFKEAYPDIPLKRINEIQEKKVLVAIYDEMINDKTINGKMLDCYDFTKNFISYTNEKIRKLKGRYSGKRCFIVATGPSLSLDDLNCLKKSGEITISMNSIHSLFDKTEWRPDFYVILDARGIDKWKDIINTLPVDYKFIADSSIDYDYNSENLYIWHNITAAKIFECPQFSEDFSVKVFNGGTVTYSCMQLAAYLGFSEIYLLGVDFNYSVNHKNHAGDDEVQRGEAYYSQSDIIVLKAYEEAERYSQNHGFRIYNATRGGKLEVFERVDFDSLF